MSRATAWYVSRECQRATLGAHVHRSTSLTLLTAVCLASAGCGDGVDPQEPSSSPDAAHELQVSGTDELLWRPSDLTVPAGPVDVRVDCGNDLGHEFVIDGVQGGEPIAVCEPAGTGSGSIELEPGSYTFFCAVPGHREEGMEGELTVE